VSTALQRAASDFSLDTFIGDAHLKTTLLSYEVAIRTRLCGRRSSDGPIKELTIDGRAISH
jgi:hypothetical protein